jgi:hypothetical protein
MADRCPSKKLLATHLSGTTSLHRQGSDGPNGLRLKLQTGFKKEIRLGVQFITGARARLKAEADTPAENQLAWKRMSNSLPVLAFQ